MKIKEFITFAAGLYRPCICSFALKEEHMNKAHKAVST